MANMFPVSPRDGGACPVRARAVTCWSQRRWHCKVHGAPVATKSRQVGVHIIPISLWFIVLTTVATRVHKPTNITGGPHIAMHLENHSWISQQVTGAINHFYVRQAQELRTYHRSHWPIDQWLTGMVLQVVKNMCSLQVLGGSSRLVSGL